MLTLMLAVTFDVYGLPGDDPAIYLAAIEETLNLRFIECEHQSDGGYYRTGEMGAEHLILQANFNSIEGEWMEEDYPEAGVLLYINETTRPHEIERRPTASLKEIKLLCRDEVVP